MATLPVTKKIGYHLFGVDDGGRARLLRKSKWNVQQKGMRVATFFYLSTYIFP